MPDKTILSETRYAKLLGDLRILINESKDRLDRAVRQELVETYWKIGKRLCQENLTQNAGYTQAIMEDLSEELGVDYSTLTRCVHFFQSYSLATSSKNLTWSHYKSLLPINNKEERAWYETLAVEDGLNVAQLTQAIKDDLYARSLKSKKKPPLPRTLARPAEATYVYKAVVDKVIDGDTLLLKIDLGFQVWKEQRVRLAGIDAPSMDEPEGREAYRFVLKQLARVDSVMVKTNKIDIYGRYVGHIFYSSKNLSKNEIFLKGEYLNQGLLDQGLAKIV